MHQPFNWAVLRLLLFLYAALAWNPCLGQEPSKPALPDLDDLPPRTFAVEGTLREILACPEKMRDLALKLHDLLEADLSTYRFPVPETERELYSRLLLADLVLERWDDVLQDIRDLRRLSSSQALKRMAVIHVEAWVKTRQEVGPKAGPDTVREAYRRHLTRLVFSLPWEEAGREMAKRRAKMQLATKAVIESLLALVQSEVTEEGRLNAYSVHYLFQYHYSLVILLPFKDIICAVYDEYLERGKEGFVPPMTEGQVALAGEEPGSPVTLAIWDTGVDVRVFPSRLFCNSKEAADGRDTDKNGYVDDLHGIGFGLDMQPGAGLLMPLPFDEDMVPEVKMLLQGIEDLQTSDPSLEAERVGEMMASMPARGRAVLLKKANAYDLYCHGTHVAGIAVAGNPFARILTVRVAFDEKALKTEEWANDFVAMCRKSVDYFKHSGVRVANMSWGWDVHEIVDNLEIHGVDGSDSDRAAQAENIFAILDRGLHEVLAQAPQILFVNGAGSAPGDRADYRWIPGIYDLDNVIPVGAVDAYGDLTPFSEHGTHVRLHADGFHVESFVPGGDRMKLSGTSMAAPQVTNLAAKLLALNPALTPREVIRLMIEGGEKVERKDRSVVLLNPRRTLDLLPPD